MRAAVFEGEGRVTVVERPDPALERADDVLIRIAANGLCGSDLRALEVPPQMVYDRGVIVGHEFSGTVVDAGDEVTLPEGARVIVHPNIWCQTCWYCRSGHTNLCDRFVHIGSMRDGGAADYCVVPERMIYRVSDDLPFDRAALAEPLACVLNGTRRAALHPGQSVLVLGAGPIGLLYLVLFKAAGGFPIVVSEPSAHRGRWARELGADVVLDPRDGPVGEAVRELTDGRGVDIAVDSVGALLADGVAAVRKAGRVLVFGLNERVEATIRPADIAYREISIEGIYIARGTFPLAVKLLTENILGFDRLVTHSLDLARFDEAIELLRAGEAVKVLVTP
jgi:threonine dehydrogenase-like Zn-dependent dehydrogenase